MKLGARIFKTGIAVTISLYLASALGLNPIIYAGLAAVLSIQPSLYRSWQNVLEQLQANTIGAILAITFTYFLGAEPFVVGLVVIIVIAINIQLKFEKSIPLSIITVIAIMESTSGNFFLFALNRFLLILTGIGASIVVNAVFLPPKYEEKLYSKLEEMNRHILEYLRTSTTDEVDDKKYRDDLKHFKHEATQIDQLFSFYQEERTYFRKVQYSKIRKLVIFKNMIKATHRAFALLKHVEKKQNEIRLLSDDVKLFFQQEVDLLASYHEKIFLKYEGKIKPNHIHQGLKEIVEGRENLLQSFINLYKGDQMEGREESVHLFSLFSSVIVYSEQLEHLNKLIESYHSYHSE